MDKILPDAPIQTKMREVTGKLISHEAAVMLREYLEYVLVEVANDACRAADHAGRKTIKPIDMEYVLDSL